MNNLVIFIFITNCYGSISIVKTENIIKEVNDPIVNKLIAKVMQSVWNGNENMCVRETLDMLNGVKNRTLWATWAWDAMQSPVGVLYGSNYHFGNYDQCMKSPWPKPVLQYCLVDVDFGDPEPSKELYPYGNAEKHLKISTKYGRSLTKQTFSVCFPSSCSPATIGKIYRLLHQFTYLIEGNVTVDPRDCQVAGKTRPFTVKFWIFWGTIAALVSLVVISTCYDDLFANKSSGLITKSFSFKSNVQELFKASESDIKVMNGMRFLTAAIVVILHETCISFALPLMNAMDTDMMFKSWYGLLLLHSDIVVDTFVAMSGLLLAKSLFSAPHKNLLIILLKRYLRLIGPYALTTFYLVTTVYETGDGPGWFRMISKEATPCENYWWKNLLMINNDVTTMCNGVSWYISCDYQLTVLTTILFFLYRRNNKLGLTVFFIVGTVLTAKYGWIIYVNSLSILTFHNAKMITDIHKAVILNETYFNLQTRTGSYFVGVFMGYILAVYKPTRHRNTISKTISTVVLRTSLATLLFIFCLASIYSLKSYNAVEVAVMVALHRSVWAAAICGIIAVAEYGNSNYVTVFLELPVFRPLSKLSYGIYLTHMILIQNNLARSRTPIKFDIFNVVIKSMGIINLSCAVSFMIYIIIEAPLIKISNELFKDKKENIEIKGEKNNIVNNRNSKVL